MLQVSAIVTRAGTPFFGMLQWWVQEAEGWAVTGAVGGCGAHHSRWLRVTVCCTLSTSRML